MKTLLISAIAIWTIFSPATAQTDTIRYFESYFETSGDQAQWTNVPSDPFRNWIFDSKGGYFDTEDELNYNPDAAYAGLYNAFHNWSDYNLDIRKMVSVPIDLSDSKRPELSFAHAMFSQPFGTSSLKVLFKAGTAAPWDTIMHYNTYIDTWAVHTLNIKDYGTKYLCKNFQLAFQSETGGEFGNCIDNVTIIEKDIINRYVKSFHVHQVDQDPVPTGVSDLPVMRLDIIVTGNTDSLKLKSVRFNSLSSHDSLFAANGFELVATRDSSFRPTFKGSTLKIGSAVNISGGIITFNNLNYNLTTGPNSIWLVTDIKSTAPHKSTVDFKVVAGSISIGSGTWPASEVSPAGHGTIEQAVFYDSFEGPDSWTISSDFEMAIPKGYSAGVTRDPDFAYSGIKVLGTDLTVDGKYPRNVSTSYFAVTPVINLKYFNDVKLSFKKWMAFETNDHGVIEVSNDNGATWQRIWNSKTDALTPDNDWVSYTLSSEFNSIAAHQEAVKVRFGIISTDNNFEYAGFNIDNFAVTGNYLLNDIGITSATAPVNDCHNPGRDSVTITLRNYADGPSAAVIPVFFSIDGSVSKRVYENIAGPIPKDGSITYTFAQPANFPAAGNYPSFTVSVQVPGDEDPVNNTKIKPLFLQKSITIPYHEDFETGGGYWKSYGNDPQWMCKIPEGSIPSQYGKSWISSPFGNYLTSDTSFLESSCYDLVSEDKLILQLNYWLDSEPLKDGASVQYSGNNGSTWTTIPTHPYSWKWNWFDNPVSSLGTNGWSGINTANWITSKQVIPASLLDNSKVKFRIIWASDEENTYRGMAIDEVDIYAAPPDIGIAAIDSFDNRCEGLNPDRLTVTIRNYGINSLKQNDTIVAGFRFNNSFTAIDTFQIASAVAPGSTFKYTFNETVDVSEPGTYNLTAFTLLEDDPWFYEANNDTLSVSFEVYPAPLTSLPDTIQTHLPDTVVLRTIYNSEYDYWWNGVPGDDTYNVNDDGWQHLLVTAARGNGCSASDSTNVELLFNDAGVIGLVHPTDDCGFSTHEKPVITIKNFGTDSIYAGQKIAVFYSINQGVPVKDTLVLTKALHSGKTINFTFSEGTADLSQKGTYHFKIYTAYGGDTLALNDTIIRTVEILGRPDVSLGPDITVEALSHTLDAGTGFESYEWDNGTVNQTREVSESGFYWVRVFDENTCDNYDTAYVRLKIRDISPAGFQSPLSACSFGSSVPVIMRIMNTGTDTVPALSDIVLSYRFMQGERISDTLTLGIELLPGGVISETLKGTVNLNAEGDYSIEATVSMAGDLRLNNDTSVYQVYRYLPPVVDFGLDETEYVEDISLDINAGYQGEYSYQWHDTSWNESIYTATESGLCHVKVTDTRTGCFDRDSVMVFLIYSDVGITWTDMPAEDCARQFENVVVRVSNLGPSVIGSSAPIYVACDVNGIQVTLDTLIRQGNFNPGAGIELILTERVPISIAGQNHLSFYTIYAQDKKPLNNALELDFNAFPSPVVDFGDVNGNLTVELPHILDAGSGQQSYLWQDNSSGQTFNVTEKGTYSVTVTGMNDCQTTKTVFVNMGSGIDEKSLSDIVIYPNPNNGTFRIDAEITGDLKMSILNNSGQVVYTQTMNGNQIINEPVNVQHLPRGIYYIVLETNYTIMRGKIIIE